jgi:phosphoglycerate dehydrogenase-like enzyme
VFAEEPLPASSPLRQVGNAFLFPHSAAIAPQYLDLFIDEFAGDFAARYG